MSIVATGHCLDCDQSTEIEFDEDAGGAPYCITCGSYEVEDVETDEIDDDMDRLLAVLLDEDDEDDEEFEDDLDYVHDEY